MLTQPTECTSYIQICAWRSLVRGEGAEVVNESEEPLITAMEGSGWGIRISSGVLNFWNFTCQFVYFSTQLMMLF